MACTKKTQTYEEQRQQFIEENKRRMEELGLYETAEAFRKTPTKRLAPVKKPLKRAPNVDFSIETRRSSRAASRPKVDYKEPGALTGFPTRVTAMKSRRYISPAAKNEAAVRAMGVKTTHPSFVKAMLKSHTSGGFWLGLPSDFCTNNFSKDDIVILEDEDGLEWECVYLHHKHGLSGGWRGFSLDHELEDGDAVVFELVTSSRFKVYIIRAAVSEEPSANGTTAVVKKREYRYVVMGSKNVHVHSPLHRALKMGRGDEFDAKVCRRSKMQRNMASRPDCSSDEQQESKDVEQISEESEATSERVEDSDVENSAQSSDIEVQPAGILNGKLSKPSKRSTKLKQESPSRDSEDCREEEVEQESDADKQATKILKEKNLKVTKATVKSKLQGNAKGEPKARPVTHGRKELSRASSMNVLQKEPFARRADRKSDVLEVRKEIGARQIEQKCNLPTGALKPVGVCSIARGSRKRKLPAMFRAKKFSVFTGSESVKVH